MPLPQQAVEILRRRQKHAYHDSNGWVFASPTSESGHIEEPNKAWTRICRFATIR